jgi:hypothetical protein
MHGRVESSTADFFLKFPKGTSVVDMRIILKLILEGK